MSISETIGLVSSIVAIITFIVAIVAYFIEKRKIYLTQYGKLKREIDNNIIAFKHFPYKQIKPLNLEDERFPKFLNGLTNDACEYCLDTKFRIFNISGKILDQKILFVLERINWLKFISQYKNDEVEIVLKRRIETLEKYLLELQNILNNANHIKRYKKLAKAEEEIKLE
jgi:hypothetical protein